MITKKCTRLEKNIPWQKRAPTTSHGHVEKFKPILCLSMPRVMSARFQKVGITLDYSVTLYQYITLLV